MVSLMIYEDFLNYDKGIYKHTAGKLVGGHAMKMIGYGQDETEGLYWVLQNQWTDDWGDKGFIKIKAGEIGIDSVALSCMPDLNEAKRQGLLF
jgi:cathepsin B